MMYLAVSDRQGEGHGIVVSVRNWGGREKNVFAAQAEGKLVCR